MFSFHNKPFLSPELQKLSDIMRESTNRGIRNKTQTDERKTRFLLEHWVSELEPAIAIDENHNIIGLTPADTPIGVKGFIMHLEDL